MKSILKSMLVYVMNRKEYIIGYEVDIDNSDVSNQDILNYIYPNGQYMRPDQLAYLLYASGDYSKSGDKKLIHSFCWFNYINSYFPNLLVNNVIATKYNIPCSYIIDEQITQQELKDHYYQYIFSCYSTFESVFGKVDPANCIDYNWMMGTDHKVEHYNPVVVKGFGEPEIDMNELLKAHNEAKAIEEEEYSKPKVYELERPFTYSTSTDRLIIPNPTDFKNQGLKVNYDLVQNLLQAIQLDYGVTFDAKLVKLFYEQKTKRKNELHEKLCTVFNVKSIDMTGRKEKPNHYCVLLCKYIGIDYRHPSRGYVKHKTGNMSFTKYNLESLSNEWQEKLNNEPSSKAISNQLKVINAMLELYNIDGDLRQVKEIYLSLYNDKLYDAEKDLITFHCNINCVDTKRFTTSDPNIQGKITDVKEMMIARDKGRVIVSVDIKAQEVVILIFGVLENEKLKQYVLETGDCYKAFAMLLDLEYTPEVKSLIKVPILSIMNGKTRDVILKEATNSKEVQIFDAIIQLIQKDPGYKKISKIAVEESHKSSAVRRGLFGTESMATKVGKYGDNSGTRYRQSLNGNFQLSAAEILTMSLQAMIYDLLTEENKYGLSIDDITPTVPIYDEMVFDVREDILEKAIELIKFYILPQVDGWIPMNGEFTWGLHYEHK